MVSCIHQGNTEHGSHPDARTTTSSSYECTASSSSSEQQHDYQQHRWFTRGNSYATQHLERALSLPAISSSKRSPNAFFVFSSEQRPKIRAEQPRIRSSELNRLLGQEWNRLSEVTFVPILYFFPYLFYFTRNQK